MNSIYDLAALFRQCCSERLWVAWIYSCKAECSCSYTSPCKTYLQFLETCPSSAKIEHRPPQRHACQPRSLTKLQWTRPFSENIENQHIWLKLCISEKLVVLNLEMVVWAAIQETVRISPNWHRELRFTICVQVCKSGVVWWDSLYQNPDWFLGANTTTSKMSKDEYWRVWSIAE